MIRSSLKYPSQTQYDSDKFLGMKRISQALLCTVAAARQAHRAGVETRVRNRLQSVGVRLAPKSTQRKTRRPPPMPGPLNLDARLAAIHAAEYPRFSDAEMARRRAALARVMEEAAVDHLLMCGEQRAGTGLAWLTSWPATVEACEIVAQGEPQVMYVAWFNHWRLRSSIQRATSARWAELT